MIKLDEKYYDSNNLLGINYDVLKEVLLKLSQSQNNIIIEIKEVKDSNKGRDKKISELEKKIEELKNLINNKEKEIKSEIKEKLKEMPIKSRFNKERNKDNENKDDDNKKEFLDDKIINLEEDDESFNIETKIKINGISINDDYEYNNFNKNNYTNRQEFDIINENRPKTQEKKNDNALKEKSEEKPVTKVKNSTFYKVKRPNYKTNQQIIDLNAAFLQKAQVSDNSLRKILHSLAEFNDKFNFLEGFIYKKFDESEKYSKKLLSDNLIETMSKFNSFENKLDELDAKNDELQKLYVDLEKKVEEIGSKEYKPEIIQIFNDDKNNNENNDIISNAFKDDINEKFELNNDRYMKAADEYFKLKQNYLTLKGITDNLTRQISLLKNDNDDIKENINIFKKEIKELIDDKNNGLKNDIKDEMDKNLENMQNNIDKKMRELLDILMEGNNNNDINTDINNENKTDTNNEIDYNKFKADKALLKVLNKKVTELNEKIEEIDEELKNQKKKNSVKSKELEDVKQCIVELYDNINSKIGKDDLKELYEFYLEHVNEIKFMKSKIEEIHEMQEKIRNETPNFIKRLESLTHDITELQENDKKKINISNEKKIDLSNYINETKLKNVLSPIIEDIDNLKNKSNYLNKTLNDITDQIKIFDKKEHVDHIEADLNEKINTLNNRYIKKFVEKIEFNKIIKNIDIQIKLLQGNMTQKKEDADTWLLAKQPIKCFNCATCEANIANSNPPNEYLAWNKYPQGEKQYRIGQGFSKLLKKIRNSEDIDKKNKFLENSFDYDGSNKLMVNSFNTNMNDNKANNKEEKLLSINNKKYKLPKVVENYRKKQKASETIPISDDEKENEKTFVENENKKNSPTILKITKIKSENEQFRNSETITNNNSRNKIKKISIKVTRNQSVPNF